MSYHNLTLMLTSMAERSNQSLSAALQAAPSRNYNRLWEILQRLNQSSLASLSEPALVSELLNQSEQGQSSFEQGNLESESHQAAMSVWVTMLLYVIYATICVLGVFGNALVCYAVCRSPSMHTVTNIFIANLALSDILLCIFCVPFTPLYLLTFKSWVFGTALCHLLPFAQGVSIYISAFTLMSIAIDRYFVILFPFKSRMQMKRCVLIIVAIWLITAILTLPYAHFMELVQVDSDDPLTGSGSVYYCDEHWPYEGTRKIFSTCTTILQFIIPVIIISFCYVRVCGKLWDRAKTIPGSVSARREEQERERTRRTNGMLISMVLIFVVSWLPLNTYNLVMDFYIEASQWQYQGTIFLFAHCAAMSSTSYNCFLYAWLNENFRKEFKEILPCCSKLKRTLFTSTLVELRQQTSKRSSCPNSSSKRSVKLNFTEADKEKDSFVSEKSVRGPSVEQGRASDQADLCVSKGDTTTTLALSDCSSGPAPSQTSVSSHDH